jgi:hypothetical protein
MGADVPARLDADAFAALKALVADWAAGTGRHTASVRPD